ncbi:D(1C) dopamine receptor-like [Actinia tenebrosa]|uniref:D(1C) dopamine receptor-like n=1 Tax=Actinia tenebrosa TaxID=6105 RepID=A0A6P8IEX8_ACTTE|nr:D(1C) dopamine receptor-like [Actinia tenebrosa]
MNSSLTKNARHEISFSGWFPIVSVIFGCLTVISNLSIIVFIVIRKKRNGRPPKKPITWFVLSLAVSDFFVGSFCIPHKLICEHMMECSDKVWEIFDIFISFFHTASITNLSMISIDRYISAVHPYFYRRSICHRSWFLILLSWILSILQEIPYLISILSDSYPQADTVDTITKLIFMGILPPIVMTYTYIRVWLVLRKHKKAIKEQANQHLSPRQLKAPLDIKKREILLLTVGIMDAIYIVCSVLFQYVVICYLLWNSCHTSYLTEKIVFTVLYFHSLPNSLIYAFVGRLFCNKESGCCSLP